MSLSWIKNPSLLRAGLEHSEAPAGLSLGRVLKNLQPKRNGKGISATENLAIVFDKNTISVAHSNLIGEKREIDWIESIQVSSPLFIGKPVPALLEEIDVLFSTVSKKLAGKYVHIQVSIPEAAAWTGFYTLDTVPSDREQVRSLARWRIAKQYSLSESELYCDFQQIREADGKITLMTAAIDREWQALLQHSFQKADLPVASIDLSIHYQFQILSAEELQEPGVLITVTGEYWSLLIWNEAGEPRFVRSRWRLAGEPGKNGDTADVCAEIIRTLLIYCHQGETVDINQVFIVGTDYEQERMVEHLQKQMDVPVAFPKAGRIANYSLQEITPMASAVLVTR